MAGSIRCEHNDAVTLPTAGLLPFREVERRLGLVSQAYAGAQTIEVDRIVGSLDRTVDFDRDFRPRAPGLASRLQALHKRYPDGDFPAINVYEVGGAYFVVDGHHRVAWSRQQGRRFIDAEVIRLNTEYELGDDVDVLTLIHTQQQRRFMHDSGLDEVRPDASFEMLRPDAYVELLGAVEAFGYRRSVEAGSLLTRAETGRAWYDSEYLPAVAAIHEVGLNRRYAFKTDADLFLWVAGKRRSLEPMQPGVSWLEAAQACAGEFHGPLTEVRYTRQRRKPLRRRSAPRTARAG
jgi:hypothetical protein